MPDIEKLEQFNQDLISLGDEPAQAARRGEEIERVMTPEEYPLNNRPQGIKTNRSTDDTPASPGPAAKGKPQGPLTDDFLSSLDPGLFSGGDDPPADTGGRAGDAAPNFDDLFDDDVLSGLPSSPAGRKPAAGKAAVLPDDPESFDAGLGDLGEFGGLFDGDSPAAAENAGLPDLADEEAGGLPEDIFGDLSADEPESVPSGSQTGASPVVPDAPDDLLTLDDSLDLDSLPEGDEGGEDDFLSGFSDDFIHNAPEDGYEAPKDDLAPPASLDDDISDLPDLSMEDETPAAPEAGTGAPDDSADLGDLGDLGDLPDMDLDASLVDTGADTNSDTDADMLPAEDALDVPDLDSADFSFADEPFGQKNAGADVPGVDDDLGIDEMPSFDDSISLPEDEEEFPSLDDNEFHKASENFNPDDLAPAASPADPGMPPDIGAGDFGANMDMDFGADSFSDEFDMSDFGKDFGLMEEVHQEAWQAPEAPAAAKADSKEPAKKANLIEEAEEEIQQATLHEQAMAYEISPENLRRIQETLSSMPLNLKVATEEILGNENADFDSLKNLINFLVRGESPHDIAPLVSRISGKKIKVPAGYEKRTGIAFEQEKRTFAYQFKQTILPVLRILLLAGALAALLIYGAYEFIYKPLYANSLYDQGLEAINRKEYDQGNELFERAYKYWPDNNRYVQYARAFRVMGQDYQATRKYQELLGMPDPRIKPSGKDRMHRAGILDYAEFLAWIRKDHSTAVTYLQRLVDADKFDHVPVLLQGDIFLEWARYVEPEAQITINYSDKVHKTGGQEMLLEAARYNYASLLSKEGQTDELLSRMLRYFMRTGKEDEVIKLKNLFLNDPKAKPDGNVIAELAGYLIDNADGNLRAMEEPYRLLVKSVEAGFQDEPGLHYQLARYFRALKDEKEEIKALGWAEKFYDARMAKRPLDRFEQIAYIDTLIRQGECIYGPLYSGNRVMDAQAYLQKARDLYERSLKTGHIPHRIPLLGRLYARLGDILYYDAGDLGGAWRQYSIARQSSYGLAPTDALIEIRPVEPNFLTRADAGIPRLSVKELIDANQDLSYKMGFVHYYLSWTQQLGGKEQAINQDLAMKEFMQATGAVPLDNINLQYALANTQYLRGDYDAAVSMYQRILQRLETEREKIPELQIYDDASHRELVEFLVRVHNNLGVSYYRLYRQGGAHGSDFRGLAMYHVGRAVEVYENAARDPSTALRPERKSQAFQNLGNMVRPGQNDDLSLSWELRQDLSTSVFSRDLATVNQNSPRNQNIFP